MRARWILAVALALVGLLWIAQGLGLLGASGGMNGEPFWAAVGALFLVVAGLVAWAAFRDRPQV